MATDDLGSLLVPPSGGKGDLFFGQGKILSWDPETFENRIEFRGTVYENLSVLGGIDAVSWKAGDLVQLQGWNPNGGASAWFIAGRIVAPGATAAEDAISFMRSTVAKQISADIAAENIFTAVAEGQDVLGDVSGFNTLPNGPEVTVDVSHTGKVVVNLSASIVGVNTADYPEFARNGGRMSVQLSGANVSPGLTARSVAILSVVGSRKLASPFDPNQTTINIGGRYGTTFVIEGLNPGLTTFTAVYARLYPGRTVDFTDRTIVVNRS